ncbi:MAG: excinuclease ABC subunit UvrC [Elusimicrobia bacterium]|nr:excinuclease ABC subunit UvrC [Elusimicrobiota bacterium]
MEGPSRSHLPHATGVYIMRDAAGEVLYVGKAVDLSRRVAQYFAERPKDLKTSLLAPLVRRVDYIACASEREALVWERRLIGRHQPFFNAMWKDDKSYPWVRLSLEEDFPRLRVVRRKRRDGARYFGPYPKVTPVRSLLRSLWKRRLIPLRPCDYEFSRAKPLAEAKVKSCLYFHTGECPAPCAGRVSFDGYRRLADDARLFFEGRYARLRTSMTKAMKAASARLDFEEAARLRDNLEGISHMGERVRYAEVRPGKVAQRLDASSGVSDLQAALALARPPHHIECFDISHLFGKQTVASMVCFKGGEPHKDHYRRFRVRTVAGIDDFAAMAEVVARRARALKEGQETLPDLILIDGGKGQLSAAEKALASVPLKLPLASLAKREEELFLPGREDPVRLEPSRPARRLVERVRDEAHRFAVTYHRLLRGKSLLGGE